MKTCSRCHQTKAEDDFYRWSRGKDGYQSFCKACQRANASAWRKAHPEKQRGYKARYLAKPEAQAVRREGARRRRLANPEAYREQQRRWRETNREWFNERQRRYQPQRRLAQYGLTQADYEGLLEQQENGCAICRIPFTEVPAHIDHCHQTGRVRGILCGPCNRALGLLEDSPELIQRALAYLQR